MKHFPEPNFIGPEPSKKRKKKPTGIIADLKKLKRYYVDYNNEVYYNPLVNDKKGDIIKWSDVEAIINKYMNP